ALADPVLAFDAGEGHEHAEVRGAQAVLLEGALERQVDVAAHASEPRDHADGGEVQVGTARVPGTQERVDGVGRDAAAVRLVHGTKARRQDTIKQLESKVYTHGL